MWKVYFISCLEPGFPSHSVRVLRLAIALPTGVHLQAHPMGDLCIFVRTEKCTRQWLTMADNDNDNE